MKPGNRLDEVLQCIVESYIETAEPVGSQAVAKRHGANLSPATIRNVMAELEERGYIQQPHTSAGRVPTDKGYRYYVDSLMAWNQLGDVEVPDVRPMLQRSGDIDDAAQQMSRLLAELTGNAGLMYLKGVRRISYLQELKREIEAMIQEEKARINDLLYTEGTSRVLQQPEFKNADRIRDLVGALEKKQTLASMMDKDLEGRKLQIHIGREMNEAYLTGFSMIVREYSVNGVPVGCLAVMGPTRMKYDQAAGVVQKLADAMTEFLNG